MNYMFYMAGTVLAVASVLMFSVSLWCFVQWFDEKTYKPRTRKRT
jgi:high-affinity Fe2+/Pb2+ permease